MKRKKTKLLFARIPEKERAAILKKCDDNDVMISQVMRKLLRLWYKVGDKIFDISV